MKTTNENQEWFNINEVVRLIHPTWTTDELIDYMITKKLIKIRGGTSILFLMDETSLRSAIHTPRFRNYPIEISGSAIQKIKKMWKSELDTFYMQNLSFFYSLKLDMHHVHDLDYPIVSKK